MHCECEDCDRCLPLRQKPELYGRIETHPGTCGFYDRFEDRNRCFECHHYCGKRVEYTDSEREQLLGGYRLNSVVDHFMTEMNEGRFGEGALTPEVIAVVSNLTQDIVYELEKRYDEGTTPIATLLEELGVMPAAVAPETQLIVSTQDNDAQEQIGESEGGVQVLCKMKHMSLLAKVLLLRMKAIKILTLYKTKMLFLMRIGLKFWPTGKCS